jgi:predicted nucleic acid-binding protein
MTSRPIQTLAPKSVSIIERISDVPSLTFIPIEGDPAHRLGMLIRHPHHFSFRGHPVFLEYEDVLKRAEQRLAHGLAPEAIDEFLAELAALIEPVEVHFRWRPQLRDANDEMVLEAAIHGRADALVTYNLADFAAAGDRFKIPVLRPADLLKMVKQ